MPFYTIRSRSSNKAVRTHNTSHASQSRSCCSCSVSTDESISIREQKVNTTEADAADAAEHKENRSNVRVLHVVIMTTIICIYIQIYNHILFALFARGYGTNAHSWRIQDASKHSADSPNKFFAIDLFADTICTVFDRQWKRE